MRYFLDTEFTDLPWTGRSRLLWLALVDETGDRELSLVDADCPLDDVSPFVRAQVLPHLHHAQNMLPRNELAVAVADFLGAATEMWAWCPTATDLVALGGPATAHDRFVDWDYQLLCGLFPERPAGWPVTCRDVHALAVATGVDLPANQRPHDPLADARWTREVWLRTR